MDLRTKIVHAGVDRDPATGASSVPVYLASTYSQKDPEQPGRFDYARSGNPTREALEKTLAELEGGATGLAFASGMAAIASTFLLFQPGDHLVAGMDVYGGTFRALDALFARWGLRTSFVDTTDEANIEKAIEPATRAIFIETPSNPLLGITDLAAAAAIARKHGLLAVADGTFATPYLQRPLEFGFDVVVHSATKFLNGHSDVIAGAAVAREAELGERLRFIQNAFGAVLGVQDSWLLLRGLKTLGARLDAEQKTAHWLAERLAALPEIAAVRYPLLPGHHGTTREVGDRASAARLDILDDNRVRRAVGEGKSVVHHAVLLADRPEVPLALGEVHRLLGGRCERCPNTEHGKNEFFHHLILYRSRSGRLRPLCRQ